MASQEALPPSMRQYLAKLGALEPFSKGLAQALGKKSQESLPVAARAPIAPIPGRPHILSFRFITHSVSAYMAKCVAATSQYFPPSLSLCWHFLHQWPVNPMGSRSSLYSGHSLLYPTIHNMLHAHGESQMALSACIICARHL